MFTQPKLYFVTPEIGGDWQSWERVVQEAVLGGAQIVQIRDKRGSSEKMVEAAVKLHPFLKKRGVPLIINDRVDVALQSGADGVHLGQGDMEVAEARRLLGFDAIIGLSVETIDQARLAAEEKLTYMAASPLFHTATKSDCSPPWGLEGLRKLCSEACHPVVAIGGIDVSHVEEVLASGASGIAVISAIACASSPRSAAAEIVSKMRSYAASQLG